MGIKIFSGFSDGVSYDYDKFKMTEWNRTVDERRKSKVSNSIKNVGLVPNPVLVNERFEIVEGQARYTVCRENNLPVFYRVIPGLGSDECAAMNSSSTNWSTRDYVNSFASQGNENYIKLKDLLDRYSPTCGANTVLVVCANRMYDIDGGTQKKIKSGAFKISDSDYVDIASTLEEVSKFDPIIRKYKFTNGTRLRNALVFCVKHDGIDNEQLLERMDRYYRRVSGYSTVEDVLDVLEEIYNKGRKPQNKVPLKFDYQRAAEKKNTNYAAVHNYWKGQRDD